MMRERRPSVRLVCAVFLAAAAVFPPPAADAQAPGSTELLAVSIDAQVVSSDPGALASRLTSWAEERGGYFTYRSGSRVVVRVPGRAASGLRELLEVSGADIVVYNPSTEDLRARIRDVEAAIASRAEALERILDYLESSDVNATLAFERELRSLNGEIEYYEGQRRSLQNRAAFATVVVTLSARERTIPDRLPSSFAWINTIDLYRFVDEIGTGGSFQ